jgi:hypothetical protein
VHSKLLPLPLYCVRPDCQPGHLVFAAREDSLNAEASEAFYV